jgi:hypothetical protein
VQALTLSSMRHVSLSDPTPTETAGQIAWHNLKVADTHHDLALFCGAARGWFKAHPEANYPDLEKALREQKLQAHLIAVKPKDESWKLVPLPTPEGKTARATPMYECIYSCRPIEAAQKELLQHWPSYEANFTALSETGIRLVGSAEEVKKAGGQVLSDVARSTLDLLMRNEKKISITVVSGEQVIQQMEEKMTKAYDGCKLEHQCVGMTCNGEPIMALVGCAVTGEKIVSAIGYIVSGDGRMRLYNAKDLRVA